MKGVIRNLIFSIIALTGCTGYPVSFGGPLEEERLVRPIKSYADKKEKPSREILDNIELLYSRIMSREGFNSTEGKISGIAVSGKEKDYRVNASGIGRFGLYIEVTNKDGRRFSMQDKDLDGIVDSAFLEAGEKDSGKLISFPDPTQYNVDYHTAVSNILNLMNSKDSR